VEVGIWNTDSDSVEILLISFTVYALKAEKLNLDEKALPALVGFIMNQHTIAKASLMA
jgi:phosphatidylethanolamine-binding protein (PEBP) family uncharacterized protein